MASFKFFAPPERPEALEIDRELVGCALLAGAAATLTVAAIAVSGLQVAHASEFFSLFGGLAALMMGLSAYQRVRMPQNIRIIIFLDMLMIYVGMSVTMMTYQYAMATFKAYPITSLIERFDVLLGFNWLEFSITLHRIPGASEAIGFCYKNWMREFAIVLLMLSFAPRLDRLFEFTTSYILAGMITLTVSGFLDSRSLDAVAAYAMPGLHHASGVSPQYLEKLRHLRDGSDRLMDFNGVIGLVAFPSFHAGAAVLLAVATRGFKWLWAPFLVFNVGVLVGTISEGGHNLADVFAGCLLAIVGLALAQALRRHGALTRASAALMARLSPWLPKIGAQAAETA